MEEKEEKERLTSEREDSWPEVAEQKEGASASKEEKKKEGNVIEKKGEDDKEVQGDTLESLSLIFSFYFIYMENNLFFLAH